LRCADKRAVRTCSRKLGIAPFRLAQVFDLLSRRFNVDVLETAFPEGGGRFHCPFVIVGLVKRRHGFGRAFVRYYYEEKQRF
jgi:hypothetical protein